MYRHFLHTSFTMPQRFAFGMSKSMPMLMSKGHSWIFLLLRFAISSFKWIQNKCSPITKTNYVVPSSWSNIFLWQTLHNSPHFFSTRRQGMKTNFIHARKAKQMFPDCGLRRQILNKYFIHAHMKLCHSSTSALLSRFSREFSSRIMTSSFSLSAN